MSTPPTAFARALQAARGKVRRRRLIMAGIAGAVLLIAAITVWLLWFSPFFVVKQVEVQGNSLLTADQVSEAAQVPQGAPLAGLDLAAIEARVGSLSQVASVDVERGFPGAVRIAVTERKLVFVRKEGSGHSWVDDEGIEFHTSKGAPKGYPVAINADPETRLLRDIATVVQALPETLDGKSIEIKNPTVDRIVLTLPKKRTVVWGSAEESELKSEVLAALLGVKAKVYDVSAPNHPTTR